VVRAVSYGNGGSGHAADSTTSRGGNARLTVSVTQVVTSTGTAGNIDSRASRPLHDMARERIVAITRAALSPLVQSSTPTSRSADRLPNAARSSAASARRPPAAGGPRPGRSRQPRHPDDLKDIISASTISRSDHHQPSPARRPRPTKGAAVSMHRLSTLKCTVYRHVMKVRDSDAKSPRSGVGSCGLTACA
jgi:hypothetical protein